MIVISTCVLRSVTLPGEQSEEIPTVTDRFGDLWQDFQATYSSVDLAPRVVRHDDALTPDFVCLPRVLHVLDALQHEWAAVRDALPLPMQSARTIYQVEG